MRSATTVLSYAPQPHHLALTPVKETELWSRLSLHLGGGYHRVWASEFNLADLGNRTVDEALRAGYSAKEVWRAVWAALELPDRER